MNRVVAGALGLLAGAALLVGCSDDKSASTASAGDTQASTGGGTEVKVDGNDLAGLDLNSVTCVKQGGKINVASGAIGGQQGLAVVMTDAAHADGGIAWHGGRRQRPSGRRNMGGMKSGSAEVAVDGKHLHHHG